MRQISGRAVALAAAAVILVTACSTTGPSAGGGGADQGKPFVFASTQVTPLLEQENVAKKILAAYQVANKKALQYLPSGADVNALSYKQLIEWAKNITEKTGQRRYGFPLGAGTTPGLIHRLIQGYFYPSYTGGLVTTFKSADAVTMWNDLKELWKYSNPQSTTYANLQEPMQAEE